MSDPMLRLRVEDFLYMEADLLDEWRLQDWLALFTPDAVYQVPSTDLPDDASADDNLFYIADDRARLEERVIRLCKRAAHAEHPRSKTRHMIHNVRVARTDGAAGEGTLGEGTVVVRNSFVVYRAKGGQLDRFVGHSRYRLSEMGDSFMIHEKRCALDMDGLRPQGRISIIL